MSKTETQSYALRLAEEFEIRKACESPSLARDLARAAVVLRRLDAENKDLRADAERYRWLRVQPDDCSAPRIDICRWTCDHGDSVNNGEGLRGDAADQAIDAAMAAAKTGDAACKG